MKELTAEMLNQVLHYDPETGIFTRKISTSSRARAGDVAGSLSSHGYLQICLFGKSYYAHRLACLVMNGEFPEHDTDHINGICTDNRWVNLRAVSRMENHHNQKMRATNTSGVMGVCWDKATGKWRARIQVGGKYINLGRFTDLDQASEVRRKAEKHHRFHENHGRAPC